MRLENRVIVSLYALVACAFGADPIIGTITVSPTFAPANAPTRIKITAVISDPGLIVNGASVQRLNAGGNGTTEIGILHDDGLNGDAVAGDHVYTLVFTLNEANLGRVFFQTTATFQGLAQRVLSSSVAVDIARAQSTLSIVSTTTPTSNAAGWNKDDVTVAFSCTGGAGGSDACPGIVRVSTDGKAQAIPGIATDGSGNTATKPVTLNLDKTAPILNITFPANGAVVATPSVTLTGTVTDALSGVASFTCNDQTASLGGSDSVAQVEPGLTPSGPAAVPGAVPGLDRAQRSPRPAPLRPTPRLHRFSCNLPLVPGSNTIRVQATDVAGNIATSTLTVIYGSSTLAISASLSPAPNPAGWNNTDVTVRFACAGGTAPVVCPPPVITSAEGSQTISGTATDAAGSRATVSPAFKIDKTLPTLAITSPAAAANVTVPRVTVTGTVTDALSGVAKLTCNGVTAVLSGLNFSCNLALVTGRNPIAVQATDVAGNSATSSLNVTLGTALTISASPSPAPNATGWNNSNVTVTFTCAGGAGTVTCPPPVVVSTDGANQVITRTATDSAGTVATASVTLKIDKTPPTIAITSPTPGTTTTIPQITVTAWITDAISGVAFSTCKGSPAAINQFGWSCNVTLAPGSNAIIVQATDVAGNSAAVSIPVTFAATVLSTSASLSPTPNATGWNNTNVTVTFTCAGGTGAVTCPQPAVVSTEGANQVVARTATDSAGNTATTSLSMKVDKTAPVLAISSPASGATLTVPQLTVTGTATDSLSGIASVTCNGLAATLTQSNWSCSLTLVAGPNTIAVQAIDIAGNSTATSIPVTFATTALSVTASIVPAPNAAGWNNANATVTFTCAGGTGTLTCPPPVVVSVEGASQVISGTVTDSAAHTASTSVTLKVDRSVPAVAISSPVSGATLTVPQLTVTGTATDSLSGIASITCNGLAATLTQSNWSCRLGLTPGPNTISVKVTDIAGNSTTTSIPATFATTALTVTTSVVPAPNAAGWNNVNATVTFTCSGGTGTLTCPPPVIVSTEGASQVVSGTVTDSAAHTATTSVAVKIDKSVPTVAINSPASGATLIVPQLTVAGTAADSLSGIASVTCNGLAATVTQSNWSCNLTLGAGPTTITVLASDIAGNSTTTSVPVTFMPTALTVTTSVVPAPNAAGWNNANATVSFTCAGGTGALTCPPPVIVATEGASQVVSGTVTDSAAHTANTSVTLKIDKSVPILAIGSPASGATLTVPQLTVAGTATDSLSGIATVTCNGSPATVTQSNWSCSLTLTVGPNTIAVLATDIAGNSTTASLPVTFAPTALSVTASIVPAPNAAGWNNVNATVSFTCAGGTGALTCPPPVIVATEGASQVVSGTVTDSATHAATTSVTLKIDKSVPTVAISSPASGATLTVPQLALTGTSTDSLSGIATVTCNGSPAAVTQSDWSCNLALTVGPNTIAVLATDIAGNSTTASLPVTFAPTALTVTTSVVPAPNAAGWNNANATVTFTCAGGTGTLTCPPPVIVATEGASQVVSGTVTDGAAHTSTTSVTLKIDKSVPTVAISSPASGATLAVPQLTVTGTATDSLSGTASVTCNGLPATLTQSNWSCNLTLTAGLNTIAAQSTDIAGNATTASIPVTFTAPVLRISALPSPAPNAAGWNRTNATITFTCGGGTGTLACPPPVVVTTEGASQVVSGTVTDSTAHTATALVTLKIDKTPPVLVVTPPASGVTTAPISVAGTATDALSGTAGVTCNGAPAIMTSSGFTCDVTLTPGQNSIAVNAVDLAGNVGASTLTLIPALPPTITLTAPANLSYFNISPTTVNGTVSDASATVTVNGLAAPVGNGLFSIAVPLAEGPNVITATATTPAGASTASIQATLDTTPPHVTITSPPDQFVTADTSISVAGSVNDIVVGTVNDQQAQVTVNGTAAQVANRTFLATSVALTMGSNVIQAAARDRAGNAATTQITVTRQAPPQQSQIHLISGNNQAGAIGSVAPASLVVALTDSANNPVPNTPVIFRITQDDGMVSTGGAPAASVVAMTNALGQAQAQWQLGMRSGAGANGVEAYAVGFGGTAVFTATGTQGLAGKIVIDAGNNQVGAVNQPLPLPLIAVVVDAGNNRLANVPVTFTVQEGGGNFAGQPAYTTNTDSDGRAAATLTPGFQEGNANNLVTANFPANQGLPASFTASGRSPGAPANTTITGLVLDNSNVAIPGVTIRAVLTHVLTANAGSVTAAAIAQTDAQGQFSIKPAPVGFVKLLVDGSTSQLTGTYPSLEYDIVTVAGQSNTVGQPIFLLPLNTANQLCATATTGGGTLTVPEAPGFSLTFGPGQVTFPGGAKDGCVSVTVVHADKIPMLPGFGQQPRFIVTIQPTGALFNPPAAITLPNVDGLKPREVTEMYSFDHDIGSFVAIGTGTVSDDGQVVRSNPGVGVLKAGWHCCGNPATCGCAAACAPCTHCDGTSCVPDSSQTGASCQNACITGGAGTCSGGSCSGTAVNCGTGNACTGTPTCDPVLGCVPGTPANCGTGNICTGTPTCDPVSGCQPGTPLNCGTGNICTGTPTCDPVLGCVPGTPLNCGTGNICTGTPTCDPLLGCQSGTPLGNGASCGSAGEQCLAGTCIRTNCTGQRDNTTCNNGGTIAGSCQNQQCTGSGSQCPTICNGGTCVNGQCSPQEFTISLSAFIPGNNIEEPHLGGASLLFCGGSPIFFAGDDRSFSPVAGSSRTRSLVTVVTGTGNAIKPGTASVSVGTTKGYAIDALTNDAPNLGRIDGADDDAALNDCHLLTYVGTASTSDMHITAVKFSDTDIQLHIYGSASNPALTVFQPAPTGAISWDLLLEIDASSSPTRWTLTGSHTGFPAHELYVNQVGIYTYDPGPQTCISDAATPDYCLPQVLQLFNPRGVTVNLNGVLP